VQGGREPEQTFRFDCKKATPGGKESWRENNREGEDYSIEASGGIHGGELYTVYEMRIALRL